MDNHAGGTNGQVGAPSCLVLGEGLVPLACLEILRRSRFEVRGVFSTDGSLRDAAAKCGAPHLESREAFRAVAEGPRYDWLFSINNGWVLPAEVIATARRGAINFHDSPLPKYAGLYATSWALLHGERDHAVSWHEVTPAIDGGRLYAQRAVPIDPTDTALTLNAKCYEAAVAAFEELARDLAAGTAKAFPQPPIVGSYFGLRDRPRGACVLSFTEPAARVVDLVRALDFGPARNPLGLAKVRVGDAFLAVTGAIADIGAEGEASAVEPGTVIRVEGGGVRVATATTAVTLHGWRTLSGSPISGEDLRARHGVIPGARLHGLDGAEAEAVSAFYANVCRFEGAWVKRVAAVAPFAHPYTAVVPASPSPTAARTPIVALNGLLRTRPAEDARRRACALFAAYAARLSTEPSLDIGFSGPAQRGPNGALFASVVPLAVARAEGASFESFAAAVGATIERLERQGTYAHDLFARYPELRASSAPRFRLVIAVAPSAEALGPEALRAIDADLVLAAYDDETAPEIIDRGGLAPWQTEAIARQLGCLARAALAAPDLPVARLPLLDEDERRTILTTWNETAASFPETSVHGLVVAQAARTPSAPAVRFGGASISYAELDRRSNQLARELAARGVARGDLVALCLARSIDLVVGLLAILKAGAAYVPIDPAYPSGRVAHMLSDSAARVIVTHSDLRARLPDGATVDALCLDEAKDRLDARDGSALDEAARGFAPDDLAYVIYTSGSTGTPKGVEITHRGLVNHSWAIGRNYQLGAGDRILCSASISFDVAGEQIYPALFRGAEVVVRPDDLFDSFTGFDRFVREEAMTAMVLPTAFWHEWVRELQRTAAPLPPSLRALSTGTEKVIGEYLAAWQAMSAGRVGFFQGYGPTETTVTCTMYAHDGSPFDEGRAVPIGRPLPNTEIYVLDASLEPSPVGVPGEIYVGGAGLARGYKGRPDLTREKFIPHPWKEGARLYRTGDLGWFEPDGQLVYAARTDFQVKMRGFRVELGEIEAVLRELPGVDEAAVVVHEAGGSKRLIAYVVTRGAFDPDAARAFVATRVPEYMVPAVVMPLSEFPKTPNQKVDRRALPPPPDAAAERVPPRDERERRVAAAWAKVLAVAVETLGVGDSFFDRGGDSLRAVRMLSALEGELGRSVPLSVFARAPTIEALAKRLGATDEDDEEPLVVVVQKGDSSRPPLWLVHPVGGHVVLGNRLRAQMSAKQPILGLQSRGLDGRRPPLETVEEMAALYVEVVRAAQPVGPYILGGPSMGGYIAIEMAERLRAAGEEVALVVLFDTYGPNYPRPTSRLVELADNARAFVGMTWRERAAKIRQRLVHGEATRRFMPPRYDVLEDIATRDGRDASAILRAIEAVTRANERANGAYVPRAFSVPTLLIRAKRGQVWSGMRFDDPANGWRALARGGLKVVDIDCYHSELVDEPPLAVGRAVDREVERWERPDVAVRIEASVAMA
jgi:amino acid adenylation domain-containing protein